MVEEVGVGVCLFLETYQLPQSDPRGVCSPKHRLGAASAHMPSHFREPDSVSVIVLFMVHTTNIKTDLIFVK